MQRLLAACVLSVVVHVGLLWFVPLSTISHSQPTASLDAVELVSLPLPEPATVPVGPDPQPAAVQDKTDLLPAAVPESQPLPEIAAPPPLVVAYDATQIGTPDAPRLHATIAQLSAEASARLALPPLQLPLQQPTAVLPDLPAPPVPDMARTALALLAPATPMAGRVPGLDKPPAPAAIVGEKQRPGDLSIPVLDRQLFTRAVLPSPPVLPAPAAGAPAGIQGPVSQREPVYRPPLPKVQVNAAGEITLKFWVRPDGMVSRVFPERKGETGLEVAAIRYLEQWRFTPLLPSEPQIEQWGTITVRFLMQER